MAECIRISCGHCDYAVEAWSDGNPYYLDADGKKEYAYHPDHERLARCIGNDVPHVCLGCVAEVDIDNRAPIDICPHCGSLDLVDRYDLAGHRCPSCRQGTLVLDPEWRAIS